MKKFNQIIVFIMMLLLPFIVKAQGYISVSPTSLTITEKDSVSFTITAYNAIGDVTITSSNTGVAKVSSSRWETGMVDEKQTKTASIAVTGVSVGSATITIKIDAATFDGDDLSGQTKTVSVNVKSAPAPTPTPTPTPTPNPTPSPQPPSDNKPVQNKSTNNKVKELSVEGHVLNKIDDNNYSLIVGPNVVSVNITGTLEDEKATITGLGNHDLVIGENNIEIIVTSESGSKNVINLKITRKDNYTIDDIETLLNTEENIEINIDNNTVISKDLISKIKNSKKTVKLNYYDEGQNNIYSWIIDGSNVNIKGDLITTIEFNSDNIKKISKLSNYADFLYLNLKNNTVTEGIKVRVNVANKYEENSKVNIYYYDSKDEKLIAVKKDESVKDGYVEFEVSDVNDYIITMSNINESECINEQSTSSYTKYIIMVVVIIALIISIVTIYYVKKKNIN